MIVRCIVKCSVPWRAIGIVFVIGIFSEFNGIDNNDNYCNITGSYTFNNCWCQCIGIVDLLHHCYETLLEVSSRGKTKICRIGTKYQPTTEDCGWWLILSDE